MTFTCLTCGADRGRRVLIKAELEVWECRSCHLVQLHPAPTMDDCVADYEDAHGFSDALLTIEDEVVARDRAQVQRLLAEGATGPLLDVGAGAGILIEAALEAGLEAEGLELAASSARRIRERTGATVHQLPIESAPLSAESFGLVTFSHSLEHVPDPLQALHATFRLLRPGGSVHIAVPNWAAGKRRLAGAATPWIYPGHVSYFTRRTLRQHLELAGFEVTHMESRPFLGIDYRFVIALLRRARLDGALHRFLQLGDRQLDDLLTDNVEVSCPVWRLRAVLRMTRGLLWAWPERLCCVLGWGEELRATARRPS